MGYIVIYWYYSHQLTSELEIQLSADSIALSWHHSGRCYNVLTLYPSADTKVGDAAFSGGRCNTLWLEMQHSGEKCSSPWWKMQHSGGRSRWFMTRLSAGAQCWNKLLANVINEKAALIKEESRRPYPVGNLSKIYILMKVVQLHYKVTSIDASVSSVTYVLYRRTPLRICTSCSGKRRWNIFPNLKEQEAIEVRCYEVRLIWDFGKLPEI